MDVKIWYIDRSRNYIYKELDSGIRAIVSVYKKSNGMKISPDEIIEALVNCGTISFDAKNKYAHLTRFRDHGFLDMYNKPSESSIDYIDGRLDMDSLIIDHFIKRPVYKDKDISNIKPFILICCFFSSIIDLTTDENEYYITARECKDFLYECNDYSCVDEIFAKRIINQRHSNMTSYDSMEENEKLNLSIWFNALKETSIFMPEVDRLILRPNKYAKSFFDFVKINAKNFEATPICDDKGDASLQYEYYCSRRKGINEVIPKVIKSNIRFQSEDDKIAIFEYLFGIKKRKNFKYSYYLKDNDSSFGIYHPFINLPYLALRNIWMQNSFMADELYDLYARK